MNFLKQSTDLDIESGTTSSLNETDTIVVYKFKYKSSEKILAIYFFKTSEKFVLVNFEHKRLSNNREEIILSDYNSNPFVIERYENKIFVGFESLPDSKISSNKSINALKKRWC